MFAWTKKTDHTLGIVAYLLVVGLAGAFAQTTPSRFGQTVLLSMVTLALALVLVGFVGRKRIRWAFSISGMLVFFYACLDAFYYRIFQKHPTHADALAAFDAFHTDTIPMSAADAGLLLSVAFASLFIWWFFLACFALLPRISWLDRHQTALARLAIALSCVVFFFQDLFFRPDTLPGNLLSLHRNDESIISSNKETSKDELHLNSSLLELQFKGLEDFAKNFPQHFDVRETPDILLIHVESLRASDFGPELFPKSTPLVGDCLHPKHHYSTGNATGNGFFGVVQGLTSAYAHLLREHPFPSLPLRALRTMGYTNHVWYPNRALEFDQLRQRIMGEDVEVHRFDALPANLADEHDISEYLARAASPTPRFDYLVLDSSHYDYSYPPEFEIHRPTGTLGGWFNPLTGEAKLKANSADGVTSSDDEKTKIRNRYMNALLYVDGLLARILSEPRQTSSRPRLVAFFGDHGEAFWERGASFGHSTQLTEAQTLVPFYLCGPKSMQTKYDIASHADIFPTIFDWMGVVSPTPFMTGKSLLRYDPSLEYAVVRGLVNMTDASNLYAVFEPGWRTQFIFWNTVRLGWVKNDQEELIQNPPPYRVARAMSTFIAATSFRSPAPNPAP